jgi:hypothetical protein
VILSACRPGREKVTVSPEPLSSAEMHNLVEEKDDTDNPYDEEGNLKRPDTLQIDYATHKDIYDILVALPDTAFSYFDWKASEREAYVQFIKEHNFTVNRSFYIYAYPTRPDKLRIGVVNGYWTLTTYPLSPGCFLVVAMDVEGDGCEIYAYEYQEGEIRSLDMDTILEAPQPLLLLNREDMTCGGLLDEDFRFGIGFAYDFDEELTISDTWYLREEKMKDCLKGNTLKFRFNPETCKFELTGISFEEYKE